MGTSMVARTDVSQLPILQVQELRCLPETAWEAALYPLLLLPPAYLQSDACLPNLSKLRGTHLISLPPWILRRRSLLVYLLFLSSSPSTAHINASLSPYHHAALYSTDIFAAYTCDTASHRPRPRPLHPLFANVPAHAHDKLLARCQSQNC